MVAFLLDWAVLAFGTFLILGDVGSFTPVPFFTTEGIDPAPRVGTLPWWGVVALIASLVLLQAYTGRTPGKAAVAIAVVDDQTGRPIGLVRTLGRWIVHLVDALLCIGYLRPLWHAERRTFADSWVRSLVVHRPLERPTRVSLAATTVCLVAVAASLTPGTGSRSVHTSSVSCSAPEGVPRATVSQDQVEAFASRLVFIRRDVPADRQPIAIDLEGLPSGTQKLLVTAAPFGASSGDLRDADRAHTWNVDLAHFPELEITPAVAPEDLNSTNDADGLTAIAYGGTMLSDTWSLSISPSEVHQLGPGISVQIVMVDADGEHLLCGASLADA